MAEKYCAYCRLYRPDDGFRLIRHDPSGTQRAMCGSCQETRRKPRSVLQQLAEQERLARKKGSK